MALLLPKTTLNDPEAGSSEDLVTKRNSRSLDLPSLRSQSTLHTRSASDTTKNAIPPQSTPTGTYKDQNQAHNQLSNALLPSPSLGFFGTKWLRKLSISQEHQPTASCNTNNFTETNSHLSTQSSPFSGARNRNSPSAWKSLIIRPNLSGNNVALTSEKEAVLSLGLQEQTETHALPTNLQREIRQFAMDGFASKYFATHKRGLVFRRRIPVAEMVQWSNDSLRQPLIMLNRDLYKVALKCFKLIQQIMGDRPRPKHWNETDDYQFILDCGISKGQMRDEIYVQICKQLQNNPSEKSVRLGWEILCVVTVTFPPSKNLETYLTDFVEQYHQSATKDMRVISQHVSKELKRILVRGAKGKVLTGDEIELAKNAPFHPSVFGETLDMIMSIPGHSDGTGLKIPKIASFLANAVLQMNGRETEGIFRVPGDAEQVTDLRVRIESGRYDISGITDPNVPASLLKYWMRDLATPLIPTELYDQCIRCSENANQAIEIIGRLPELSRRVLLYMIDFVQNFTDPKVIKMTLMNVHNLAMVYAPNFLRCPSACLNTVLENSKYEQAFIRLLITRVKVDKVASEFGFDLVARIKES